MTKRVEVNGQILEFPDDMPEDQMESVIRQFNAPQSFEVNSAGDYAKAIGGLGEIGLSGLTSFARQIPLGLTGIAGTVAGLVPGGESPNEKANRWMQEAPIPGPYEPRLGPAQVLSRGLAEATEPVARGAEWLEDVTETPYPLLNTALKTAVVGVPQVLPGGAAIKALRATPAPAGTFVPSINDLYKVGRVAFNEARINGGGIKPEALSRLRRGVSEFRNEAGVRIGFNEKLHPQAVAVREEIFKALDEGIDFDRLLELREMAGGVAGNADRAIAMRGVLLKNQIDDFVDSLKPSDVISGDPARAASSLDTARALWRDASKARTIEEQIEMIEIILLLV